MRKILEAKVAIKMRPLCFEIISFKASSTILSLLENPSLKALVLSLSNSLTPFLPIAAILWISATGPIGVKSNLKSPVETIMPFGVSKTTPKLSGMEWVVVKNSI